MKARATPHGRTSQPAAGKEALREFAILNGRVQVVTKDSNKHVALWDIVCARKLQDYGQIDFDEKVAGV